MNTLLVIIQFARDSARPWSQSRIRQVMTRNRATYVSLGVYMVLTSQTAEELRDELIKAAELTDKDFIGVFTVAGHWASLGHSQRGVAQPKWPTHEGG